MNTETIANNVKQQRLRKGFSQEALAEKTGLNLRTLQRIEKGETIPRGDTLQRLAKALETSPDELIDWTLTENHNTLIILNFSMLCFLIFPLFGILVPLVLWISQKNKIQGVNNLGRRILNFQITLNLIVFLGYVVAILGLLMTYSNTKFVYVGLMSLALLILLVSSVIGSGFCIVVTLINAYRISRKRKVWYKPAIPFLKNLS